MIPIVGRAALAEIGKRHLELAELYRQLSEIDWDRDVDTGTDRVLSLAEAAVRLGVKRSWLSRRENYLRIGGYLGPDRRVKFPLSALLSYVNAQKH